MDEQMMAQMQEKISQMKGLIDEMMALMGGGEAGEQKQMQVGYARARGPAPGQPPTKPGMGM